MHLLRVLFGALFFVHVVTVIVKRVGMRSVHVCADLCRLRPSLHNFACGSIPNSILSGLNHLNHLFST